MKDNLFKDTFNFGMGVFSYSKEKVQKIVDEMVDRGEVEKDKAQDLVDDMVQKGKEERKNIEEKIDERIKLALDKYFDDDRIRRIVNEELDKRNLGE